MIIFDREYKYKYKEKVILNQRMSGDNDFVGEL